MAIGLAKKRGGTHLRLEWKIGTYIGKPDTAYQLQEEINIYIQHQRLVNRIISLKTWRN